MTEFEDFYKDLSELIKSHSGKIMLRLQSDVESETIQIFGEKASSIDKAKKGLAEASEIAFTTAEHHPYWSLLYNSCQIAKMTLEKWESELTKEEINEISWSIDELKNTCKKIIDNPSHNHSH
ncbi:MAG: hypothetical protein ACKO7N_03745 [Candidatus Nitrosotenuis sp.]